MGTNKKQNNTKTVDKNIIRYNNIESCILELFDKNDDYQNFKRQHSELVKNIAVKIYTKYCDYNNIKINNVTKEKISLAALLHDTGKIDRNTRLNNHDVASSVIATSLLTKFNYEKDYIDDISSAVLAHSNKVESVVKNIDYISRTLIEADIISKLSINAYLTVYNGYDGYMANLDKIEEKHKKSFIKLKCCILSPHAMEIANKYEKDFIEFNKLIKKQLKLINKKNKD